MKSLGEASSDADVGRSRRRISRVAGDRRRLGASLVVLVVSVGSFFGRSHREGDFGGVGRDDGGGIDGGGGGAARRGALGGETLALGGGERVGAFALTGVNVAAEDDVRGGVLALNVFHALVDGARRGETLLFLLVLTQTLLAFHLSGFDAVEAVAELAEGLLWGEFTAEFVESVEFETEFVPVDDGVFGGVRLEDVLLVETILEIVRATAPTR